MGEISVVPFKFKYLQHVIDLHKDRSYPHADMINMKSLPRIGYIAYYGTSPVAAGFLRRVEGGMGMLDALVSSPHFGSRIRHEGISGVVNLLLADAKAISLTGVLAFSSDDGVLKRAKSIGFNEIGGERLIVLNLWPNSES